MTKTVLLILVGVVVGSFGTTVFRSNSFGGLTTSLDDPIDESGCTVASNSAPESLPSREHGQEIQRKPGSADDLTNSAANVVAKFPVNSLQSVGQSATDSPIAETILDSTNLPEIYRPLIEPQPESRRRMTPQENHAFFDQDVRDESWAYTMELGIKEYLAANQIGDGAIIESIECRSRMCEIAGVVYAGGNDDFSNHVEAMRQSGWWQLSQSQSTTGGNVSGDYRFVTFIPRDSEDTLTLAYASSICD